MLKDEKVNSVVISGIAYALGQLGDKSIVKDLLQMLKDEKVNSDMKGGIAYALGQLIESVTDCEKLLETLNIQGTSQEVFDALNEISKRTGYVIFSKGNIKEA